MNIAYILWQFPKIHTTFILNELLELKDSHADKFNIKVYSIKKPTGKKFHKRTDEFIKNDTYCPATFSLKIMFYFILGLIKHPILFFSTLYDLLLGLPIRPISLFRYSFFQSIYCFVMGVYLSQIVRKNKIDYLHTHFAESAGLITMIVSKLVKIDYSITMHAYDIFRNQNKKLVVRLAKNSLFTVTISDYNKRYLVSLDSSVADKIRVIHCGVNFDMFKQKQRRQQKTFKIITTAALSEKKGVKDVVSACSRLTSHMSFEYDIIGEGPLRNEIEDIINKNNLNGTVNLLGMKTQAEVLSYLQNSDLFILFCKVGKDGNQDGIPVALMEAMAIGLPVISTHVSGIPELIKDGGGYLVKENDEDDLVECIKKSYKLSPLERESVGEKGQRIVYNEFNLKTEVAKLAKLFEISVKN